MIKKSSLCLFFTTLSLLTARIVGQETEQPEDVLDIQRHYYVHPNQLRQQLLTITGPEYDAVNMNLGSLYQLTQTNNSIKSLVNSPTCGNVALAFLVNSTTCGNQAVAAAAEPMRDFAFLKSSYVPSPGPVSTVYGFNIISASPNDLISISDTGSTITFNVAGKYFLIGSIYVDNIGGSSAFGNLSLICTYTSGSTSISTTYSSSFNVNLGLGSNRPMGAFYYTSCYTASAGDTLVFTTSNNYFYRTPTMCIIRIS